MEHDALIDLGLDEDGAIGRIGRFPTLLDAWEGCDEPSDLIWIAARTCQGGENTHILAFSSMVLAGNMISEAQPTLKLIHRQIFTHVEDPKQNIVQNVLVAMNAALIDGEKNGVEIVGEGEESRIVFDRRHHNHLFMWQSLRAISLLYAEEFAEAAEHFRFGWSLFEDSFKPTVAKFLRSGINYERWFADWLKERAVGEG